MDGDNLQSTRSLTGQDGVNIDSIVGPPNSFIYLDSAGDVETLAFSDGFLKSTSNIPSFDYPTVDEIDTTVLTASRAMITDSSKRMRTSVVTSTELAYIQGLTSNLQTQLNNINNYISIYQNVLFTNTPSRAAYFDSSGELKPSTVTSSELGYLSGVTSGIQTQINTTTTDIDTLENSVYNMTPSRACVSNASGDLTTSSVTSTELGYVSGVTSSIQTQINTLSTGGWTETSTVLSPNSGTVGTIGCDGDKGIFASLGVGYANGDALPGGFSVKNQNIEFHRTGASALTMQFTALDSQNIFIDMGNTTYPDYALRLIHNSSGTSDLIGRNGDLRINARDSGLILKSGNTDRLSLSSSGNLAYKTNVLYGDYSNGRIGILNSSPSVPLDVTGAAKISGDFSVDTNVLKVDTTNNRVGVNITSPTTALDVVGQIKTSAGIDNNGGNIDVETGYIVLQNNSCFVTTMTWDMTSTSPANAKYDGSGTPDYFAPYFTDNPSPAGYYNPSGTGVTVDGTEQYFLTLAAGYYKCTISVTLKTTNSTAVEIWVGLGSKIGAAPSAGTFTASEWNFYELLSFRLSMPATVTGSNYRSGCVSWITGSTSSTTYKCLMFATTGTSQVYCETCQCQIVFEKFQ